MKAWVLQRPDGPDGLVLADRPSPTPGPWELRIAVRASALNRADLLQMRGLYPAPPGAPADVCGLEYAGEVAQVGDQVTLFKPGDRVMGLVGGGAFAGEVVVHEREALPLPAQLSFAEGAAIPEAFLTAWDALVLQGGLSSGEWALVHAAASGVGTAAVQLVRALGGRVVGTSRSEEKLDRLTRDFGMEAAVLTGSPPSFAARVRELTCGRGADLALELVGGAYLPETCAVMAPRGRVMLVGLLAGSTAHLDLRAVLTRRLVLKGTVLRSRPPEEKLHLAQAAVRHLLPLFESRALRPVIDEVAPMTGLKGACARLAANDAFGKIVLQW